MAAIVYSTANKIASLARLASTTDDKFMSPNEFSARVRQSEIDFTATGGAVSTPIIIGRFDRPVTILGIVLVSDDAIADFDMGVTPISAPVDTDQSLGAALALVANTELRPPLAINYDITEPSLVFINPQTGDLAEDSYIKGYILYVDNT